MTADTPRVSGFQMDLPEREESVSMAEESKDETATTESEPTAADTEAVQVAERPEVIEPWDWLDAWPGLQVRRSAEPWLRRPSEMETIRVEQYRDGNDLVVRAELPGVDPDEAIDVSVTGDLLTISANRERREESKTDEGFRSEFHYGSFRRGMRLPAGTSAEQIKASYDDGILEVRVPTEIEETAKTKVPVERKSS